MGPNYPGEGKEYIEPPVQSLPMHGPGTDDEFDNDDEFIDIPYTGIPHLNPNVLDEDSENPHVIAGYQPLNFIIMDENDDNESSDEDFADFESANIDQPTELQASTVAEPQSTEEATNEKTLDGEILQEIWNSPRPSELDIELDATKTEEIKTAMSTISLGLQKIQPPEWASNIPESKWIEELLEKVRTNKTAVPSEGLNLGANSSAK